MFSVIIPVHNKLPHIERSVYSVLNQTFGAFELLLIDDASTDGSREKLNDFKDPRIRIFHRDKAGAGGYAARNLGIKAAKYQWISFLDADDEWNIHYLKTVNEGIVEYPRAQIISMAWSEKGGSQYEGVLKKSTNGAKIPFTLVNYLEYTPYMWTSAVTVQKDLILRVGLFPDDGNCKRGGDVDTWVRCLRLSKENIHISRPLAVYFRDTSNRVTSKPNTLFCAYETLDRIYKSEKDMKLRKTIRHFSNQFLYNMLARQVRSGLAIDYAQVKKMYINGYAVFNIIKLHVLRVKYWNT